MDVKLDEFTSLRLEIEGITQKMSGMLADNFGVIQGAAGKDILNSMVRTASAGLFTSAMSSSIRANASSKSSGMAPPPMFLIVNSSHCI